jgi:hypothetical protein
LIPFLSTALDWPSETKMGLNAICFPLWARAGSIVSITCKWPPLTEQIIYGLSSRNDA